MNGQPTPVKINILDKEYLISCNEDEREQLRLAVDILNEKIFEVKHNTNVIGTERIAVMAALNIAHELVAHKQKDHVYTTNIDTTLRRLQCKINDVLARKTQLDV